MKRGDLPEYDFRRGDRLMSLHRSKFRAARNCHWFVHLIKCECHKRDDYFGMRVDLLSSIQGQVAYCSRCETVHKVGPYRLPHALILADLLRTINPRLRSYPYLVRESDREILVVTVPWTSR